MYEVVENVGCMKRLKMWLLVVGSRCFVVLRMLLQGGDDD